MRKMHTKTAHPSHDWIASHATHFNGSLLFIGKAGPSLWGACTVLLLLLLLCDTCGCRSANTVPFELCGVI